MDHGTRSSYRAGCRCEPCCEASRAYQRELRRRNGDRIRARDRAYYAANAERKRQLDRERHARHRSKRIAAMKRWADANRDKVAENTAAWVAANPDRKRANRRNYKYARLAVPFTPAGQEYAAILYRDPCSYCGAPADTIDHITPISRGGDGEWLNLTAACASCNSRKRAKPLLRFLSAA